MFDFAIVKATNNASEPTWASLRNLAISGLRSSSSKRNYALVLDRFHAWYTSQPRVGFTKAVVQEYLATLEGQRYAPSTIALHLAAIRRLVGEAADNGLADERLVTALTRVRAPRQRGRRIGNWLSRAQASSLMKAPSRYAKRQT